MTRWLDFILFYFISFLTRLGDSGGGLEEAVDCLQQPFGCRVGGGELSTGRQHQPDKKGAAELTCFAGAGDEHGKERLLRSPLHAGVSVHLLPARLYK